MGKRSYSTHEEYDYEHNSVAGNDKQEHSRLVHNQLARSAQSFSAARFPRVPGQGLKAPALVRHFPDYQASVLNDMGMGLAEREPD